MNSEIFLINRCFRATHFFCCIGLMLLLASCSNQDAVKYNNGAVPPQAAAATFELEPGFKIELIASEPLVADPVDMEIDEYGRLYVVEMHGYPLDKSGSGKIKLLSDTDGDGKMDKSTVFADKLVLPNGVMRWKKGILVTDAPYVLYFEDTNGDGQAEKRDTILSGFSLSNPHINANNPLYGLDNWIHIAHRGAIGTRNYADIFGDEGTDIVFPGKPNAPKLPKNADSRSVRFRTDAPQIEMTSGRAQFGHSFDAWGHHFFGDNQNHAFAEAIALPYVTRNANLMVPDATEAISDHGAAAEIFQITTNPERQMFSGAGTMTSASGIVSYTGGAFPAPFDKNLTFICESVSNLVHADKQKDTGATYISSRVGRPAKEFLASKDAWSRPVNLYVGPDGALYMVDYYRRIIEHPEWMSDEAIKAGGLCDGIDMGRIYRITTTDAKPAEWTKGLKLGDATSEQLVEALSNSNSWWRINAQRLLVDRQDKTIVLALVALAKTGAAAEGRLHALWTLEGLASLDAVTIEHALKDTVAGMRENAIKLAEIHLTAAPALAAALINMQNDADPKVRYQLLCTLGSVNSPQAEQARENLLFKDINDKWVQVAALSAGGSQSGSLLSTVLKKFKAGVPAYASLVSRLTTMVGASGEPAKIKALLKQAAVPGSQAWQAPVLEGLAQGLRSRKPDPSLLETEQPLLVKTIFEHASDPIRKAAFQLLKVSGISNEALAKEALAKAIANAADKNLPDEKRVDAVNIISLKDPKPSADLLKKLVVPQEHPSLQMVAIKTLSLIPDKTVTDYLLQQWAALTPGIRETALNTFMANPERKQQLLEAVAAGKVQAASVGWGRSAQLMQDSDDAMRNKARELFVNKDEDKINKEFQKALELKGNFDSGKVVFQNNCAICHQIRGELGVAFGPDLGTVQNWLPKDIMANVLAPNASIAVGYDVRELELNSGETIQGIIASETPSAITLKSAPGAEKIYNRQDIKSLKILDMSLMPAFTQQVNHQQMADLIAFLRQVK